MFSLTKRYKILFVFSGILIATSIILFSIWRLRPGVDFRGGNLFELEFSKPVSTQSLYQALSSKGFGGAVIQPVSSNHAIIKTEQLSDTRTAEFKKVLSGEFGETKELRFESIGPTISKELVRKAYWQIVLVNIGILLYVAYAFRKIGNVAKKYNLSSWRLGIAAIVALIHDLIITVGFFVVLGKFRGVEVDSLFVTALLTILGFSVHDTIVVFDRIRENLQKFPYKSLATIIDYSVNSTLARSINTSSTLIFVLIAMLLFGGQTIYYFVLALLVGVSIGTYSSIFIASPILLLGNKQTK